MPAREQKKFLVAYFSWGGNTQHVAAHIASLTGGTLFRIEPEKPYPAEYTPCTEVAKTRKGGRRPPRYQKQSRELGGVRYGIYRLSCLVVDGPDDYPYVRGKLCFNGKTVVPFCTYAATYRDETLARIVELTPAAEHLKGFGTIGKIQTEWKAG